MHPSREWRLRNLNAAASRENDPAKGFRGFACYAALPALELERAGEIAQFRWDCIERSLSMLYDRVDCQDFAMAALIRMLHRYPESRLLTSQRRQAIADACLQAKYHPLDPGADACVWFTENHQALYFSTEYLLGQLFPDAEFANTGKLGCWHRERGRERMYQWLDHRTRFGFCEWNAMGYYSMNVVALLNLAEFAADPILRHRAHVVLELLLFHVAINTWRGIGAGSQGRAYEHQIKGMPEMVRFAQALWWAKEGVAVSERTTLFLCASDYDVPAILGQVARDLDRPVVCRERHSLHPDAGPAYGVYPDRQRDIWFWGAAGMIEHENVVDTHYAWFNGEGRNSKYWSSRDHYRACRVAGKPTGTEDIGYAMTTANVYTYRTPDYLLSCTQSYRPGCPGNIQHIWTAVLGPQATIYGTNPVVDGAIPNGRPGPWQGNGILPHAVQCRNVLLALYRIRPKQIRYFTEPWPIQERVHIWVPRQHLDEVVDQDGRLYIRRGPTYLAIASNPPGAWRDDNEWNIEGPDIALALEAGSERDDGSFADFIIRQAASQLEGDRDRLVYHSPSVGALTTGWQQPLTVNGTVQPTDDYPRFDNPWCQADFGVTHFDLHCGSEARTLDAQLRS